MVGTAPIKNLWELDLTNLAWSEVIANCPNPSARHSMGFLSVSQENNLLFGGQNQAGVSTSAEHYDYPYLMIYSSHILTLEVFLTNTSRRCAQRLDDAQHEDENMDSTPACSRQTVNEIRYGIRNGKSW